MDLTPTPATRAARLDTARTTLRDMLHLNLISLREHDTICDRITLAAVRLRIASRTAAQAGVTAAASRA